MGGSSRRVAIPKSYREQFAEGCVVTRGYEPCLVVYTRPDFGQTQAASALLRDFAAWLRSSYRAADVIDETRQDDFTIDPDLVRQEMEARCWYDSTLASSIDPILQLAVDCAQVEPKDRLSADRGQ